MFPGKPGLNYQPVPNDGPLRVAVGLLMGLKGGGSISLVALTLMGCDAVYTGGEGRSIGLVLLSTTA